jgi:serine protease Do
MRRQVALALGASALLAGLAVGPSGVRAGEKGKEVKEDKKVEKHVRVVHLGDGAFLGVGLEDTKGDVRGAVVESVEPDSPAAKAGIEKDDVIVRFDGEDVRSAAQLTRLVRETPPGRSVAIDVRRGSGTQKLTATLGERRWGSNFHVEVPDFDLQVPEPPSPPHAPAAPQVPLLPRLPHAWQWRDDGGRNLMFHFGLDKPRLGIGYLEMGEQLAAYFKAPGGKGVLVTSVEDESPAARAGIKAGDVVLEFDGKPVDDGESLRDAVREAEGGKAIPVEVLRDGREMKLEVTLPEPETKPETKKHPGAGIAL